MQRIFTFFFALLSVCTFSTYAAIIDGTCGSNLTWTLNTKDSTLTISGTGEMTDYDFLSSAPWKDYTIYIKYVTLPDGLTSIGYKAFYYCDALTSITIPNSVTSIGYDAFDGCSSLTSVTLGNSVTSIGDYAFDGCYSLTSVTLGNSVTSIGERAFSNCSKLTSITIPNSVTSIGNSAFSRCTDLTSVTIPNSVTRIGDYAFSYCSGLTSIVVEKGNAKYDCRENCNAIIETATNTLISGCQNTIIPNSVTSIGDGAFSGCSSLTSITIPNSVTTIESQAFYGCSSLTSITIPNSVTSIVYDAFALCSSLTSIIIHNSVTSIGEWAFWGCDGLTSVSIGNSVTSIGEYAFKGCSKIREVTSYAATPPAATTCGLNQTVCTLNVPADYVAIYSNTIWWEDFKEIRAIAQYEEGADKEFEVIFSDQDNNELSAQSVTLRVPVAPQIEGFTFLYWLPVAAPLDDVITIQAVYGSNTPTEAPEVFVNPSNPAQKLIRNGQVYILQEDKMYTISGQVVK